MTNKLNSILEVGPVHAGIIEPGLFRFTLHGERVDLLEIELGFQHRGIERLIVEASDSVLRQMCLAEQIAGDTTIGHAIAMAQILENGNCHPIIETEREIALEMERTATNISDVGALCADVGYQLGQVACEALRTMVVNCMQRLCGNRYGRTLIRPAGSDYRMDLPRIEDILRTIREVGARFSLVARDVNSSPSCLSRFEDICPMPRRCGRYGGDIAERVRMRFDEVIASRKKIEELGHLLGTMWWETYPCPNYNLALKPNENYRSTVVGWRGEIVHLASTNALGQIASYRIEDPSKALWAELAESMRDGAISDFPINNKSFNLSYCGVDL